MTGCCSQPLMSEETQQYLILFCVGYVDLILHLSSYFVSVRVCKYGDCWVEQLPMLSQHVFEISSVNKSTCTYKRKTV